MKKQVDVRYTPIEEYMVKHYVKTSYRSMFYFPNDQTHGSSFPINLKELLDTTFHHNFMYLPTTVFIVTKFVTSIGRTTIVASACLIECT